MEQDRRACCNLSTEAHSSIRHRVCGGPKASVGQGRKTYILCIINVTVLIESHNEMSEVHMASCHHTATGWSYGYKANFRLCVSNIVICYHYYYYLGLCDFLSLCLSDTLVKIVKTKKQN